MEETLLDKALYHLYNCSHDYKVWTGDYPDWYNDKDKAWFDKEKACRYKAMLDAAQDVAQQILYTHAAHVDPYKKIAWSESE